MKVLSAAQIREADAYTIEHEPIASIDLMERASKKCVDWMLERKTALSLSEKSRLIFYCGVGNNGGDGLAMARLFKEQGYDVVVYVLQFADKYSTDFESNLQRLKAQNASIHYLTEKDHTVEQGKEGIIVDAIFGSGLKRPIDGWISEVVDGINADKRTTISIDMPSGLFAAYETAYSIGTVINADITLTFQLPKLSQLLPDTGRYAGDWRVLDIGLSKTFIEKEPTDFNVISFSMASILLRTRKKYSHKGTFGHSLIVGGSKGKMGAVVLASKACLRAGTGLLTAYVPACGLSILQSTVPEAMTEYDEQEEFISTMPTLEPYNAIGFGPGIGVHQQSQAAFKLLIQQAKEPLVIDADGINILAENMTWMAFLPQMSILTPHPGEFRRLTGGWDTDVERLEKQRELSLKHQLYLIVKGAHTSISCPDGKVYFNSTGNPGMATAGSGDTLTGIITSLLAQSYTSLEASILGVFLHGLSGDLAAEEMSEESLMASDIIQFLPQAIKMVHEYRVD